MTEDKAEKALKQVTINFIPADKSNAPVVVSDVLSLDITDKLGEKEYCLDSIHISYGSELQSHITYIPLEEANQFKNVVETILDAVIVNSKQRESAQKLLDNAFYNRPRYDGVI